MNIAVPALLIFVILLPGFIFLNAFEKTENTDLERKPFQSSSAGAFAIAMVIQLLLSCIIDLFIKIDFQLITKILFAVKLDPAEIQSLSKSYHLILMYFIACYIFSYAAGKLMQKILLEMNPYKNSLFSFDTPWYYELKGKISEASDAEIIKISCMQDSKDGTVFYYGYLEDFYLNKNGNLDRLVLSDVYRRKLEHDDTSEEKPSSSSRFYKIKGDRLVIKYDQILNMNIEYLFIEELRSRDSDINHLT